MLCYIFIFQIRATLYPSSRSLHCISFLLYITPMLCYIFIFQIRATLYPSSRSLHCISFLLYITSVLCYIFIFQIRATLYPSSRSSHCISFLLYIYFNKFKTKLVKIMGKISKVMPQPKFISPGKGREALRQKSKSFVKIWYGLTVHIIRF